MPEGCAPWMVHIKFNDDKSLNLRAKQKSHFCFACSDKSRMDLFRASLSGIPFPCKRESSETKGSPPFFGGTFYGRHNIPLDSRCCGADTENTLACANSYMLFRILNINNYQINELKISSDLSICATLL